MSQPAKPKKVKLILSAIYSEQKAWQTLIPILEDKFGEMDYCSKQMDFNYTDYYEKEMGSGLKREFVSFSRLIDPVELPGIKLFTNQLEIETSAEGRRVVNLDPGYLSLDNLVLATGKPSPHRIYLRDGIYADLHLIYESGSYKPLKWTYPDYASQSLIALFNRLREVLKVALKVQEESDE